jgi:hypothetical protein
LRGDRGSAAEIDLAPQLHGPTEPGLDRRVIRADIAAPRSISLLQAQALDRPVAGVGEVVLGRETIYRDGDRVGWLTSGGFGYTIGRSIGYGYVRNPAGVTADDVTSANYELEVGGERVPADVSLQPFYDPTNAKVKS